MRCWGRTKIWQRCKNAGQKKFWPFCPHHTWQPIVQLFTIVGIVATILGLVQGIVFIKEKFKSKTPEIELRREVYLEISLACHRWKNAYMSFDPDRFRADEGQFTDIWERLEKTPPPSFSAETWRKYLPLFVNHANAFRAELDRISVAYGNLLPEEFRKHMIDTQRLIIAPQTVYQQFPAIIAQGKDVDRDPLFHCCFQQMIQALTRLSREADRLREKK